MRSRTRAGTSAASNARAYRPITETDLRVVRLGDLARLAHVRDGGADSLGWSRVDPGYCSLLNVTAELGCA
ncbi:hypothetical protein Acor_75120 [Acrocarpospora corrugata]|uniref:Uncharacterized protein n=1 Tax=Acrocarpospora corrugata TaxID=35763 RepID=A0A5M3W996_9ACTN|nr:hypothetical protein Acor_75120 [Acrocarpospora corrugata]